MEFFVGRDSFFYFVSSAGCIAPSTWLALILGLEGITDGLGLVGGAGCWALQRISCDPHLSGRLGMLVGRVVYLTVMVGGVPYLHIGLCCAPYLFPLIKKKKEICGPFLSAQGQERKKVRKGINQPKYHILNSNYLFKNPWNQCWVFFFEEFKYFHKCYPFIFLTLSVHISLTQSFLAAWNAMWGSILDGNVPAKLGDWPLPGIEEREVIPAFAKMLER